MTDTDTYLIILEKLRDKRMNTPIGSFCNASMRVVEYPEEEEYFSLTDDDISLSIEENLVERSAAPSLVE